MDILPNDGSREVIRQDSWPLSGPLNDPLNRNLGYKITLLDDYEVLGEIIHGESSFQCPVYFTARLFSKFVLKEIFCTIDNRKALNISLKRKDKATENLDSLAGLALELESRYLHEQEDSYISYLKDRRFDHNEVELEATTCVSSKSQDGGYMKMRSLLSLLQMPQLPLEKKEEEKMKEGELFFLAEEDFFEPPSSFKAHVLETDENKKFFFLNVFNILKRAGFSFSGENLDKAYLQDVSFRGLIFDGASLKNADLENTIHQGGSYEGVDFTNALVKNAHFDEETQKIENGYIPNILLYNKQSGFLFIVGEGRVNKWSLTSLNEYSYIASFEGSPTQAVLGEISPNGERFVIASHHEFVLYDSSSGAILWRHSISDPKDQKSIEGVHLSCKGNYLMVMQMDNQSNILKQKIWRISENNIRNLIVEQEGHRKCLFSSTKEDEFVVLSKTKVSLFCIRNDELEEIKSQSIEHIEVDDSFHKGLLFFSNEGSTLFFSPCSQGGVLYYWDLEKNVLDIKHEWRSTKEKVLGGVFNDQGIFIYLSEKPKFLPFTGLGWIGEGKQGSYLPIEQIKRGCNSFLFTQDGKFLVSSIDKESTLSLYDMQKMEVINDEQELDFDFDIKERPLIYNGCFRMEGGARLILLSHDKMYSYSLDTKAISNELSMPELSVLNEEAYFERNGQPSCLINAMLVVFGSENPRKKAIWKEYASVFEKIRLVCESPTEDFCAVYRLINKENTYQVDIFSIADKKEHPKGISFQTVYTSCMALSPPKMQEGKRSIIFASGHTKRINFWANKQIDLHFLDLKSGTKKTETLCKLSGNQEKPKIMKFNLNGEFLAVLFKNRNNGNGFVRIYSIENKKPRDLISSTDLSINLISVGNRFIVTQSQNGQLDVWDVESCKKLGGILADPAILIEISTNDEWVCAFIEKDGMKGDSKEKSFNLWKITKELNNVSFKLWWKFPKILSFKNSIINNLENSSFQSMALKYGARTDSIGHRDSTSEEKSPDIGLENKHFFPELQEFFNNKNDLIRSARVTGRTFLHLLALKKESVLFRLVLQKKIPFEVDAQDYEGTTPLFIAASLDDYEMVSALLQAGADVNKMNHRGVTPLLIAVWNGRKAVLDLLVENGADITLRNNVGLTSIHALGIKILNGKSLSVNEENSWIEKLLPVKDDPFIRYNQIDALEDALANKDIPALEVLLRAKIFSRLKTDMTYKKLLIGILKLLADKERSGLLSLLLTALEGWRGFEDKEAVSFLSRNDSIISAPLVRTFTENSEMSDDDNSNPNSPVVMMVQRSYSEPVRRLRVEEGQDGLSPRQIGELERNINQNSTTRLITIPSESTDNLGLSSIYLGEESRSITPPQPTDDVDSMSILGEESRPITPPQPTDNLYSMSVLGEESKLTIPAQAADDLESKSIDQGNENKSVRTHLLSTDNLDQQAFQTTLLANIEQISNLLKYLKLTNNHRFSEEEKTRIIDLKDQLETVAQGFSSRQDCSQTFFSNVSSQERLTTSAKMSDYLNNNRAFISNETSLFLRAYDRRPINGDSNFGNLSARTIKYIAAGPVPSDLGLVLIDETDSSSSSYRSDYFSEESGEE